jgi:CheY-like chemotaxis protein
MRTPTRPPPKVLLIHDGTDVEAHFQHLTGAGLTVSQAHAEDAVAAAIRLQPDIIVLDFRCDGQIMARLKGEPATAQIPVIALAELGPGDDAHLDAPGSEA